MIDKGSEKRWYDKVYKSHSLGITLCHASVDNLPKARRLVRQVLKTFGITARLRGAKVLDLGCGLGYVSEALRLEGARVVAIDLSEEAIRFAKQSFPNLECRCMVFPEEFGFGEKFDLIWIQDNSTMDTFDATEMDRALIGWAQRILKPGGLLIVGWHSDFSGRLDRNWCHWDLRTIRELRTKLGFSGPRVVQVRLWGLSWLTIWACKMVGKSCPIFFMWRKTLEDSESGDMSAAKIG